MVERLLIENCNVINSIEPSKTRSILVEDGRITRLSEESTQVVPEGTPKVDARGGTALPGLVDTHCHLVGLGAMRRVLDLMGTTNITTLRLRLFGRVSKAPTGEWIVGRGWDQELFPGRRYPARDDIDDISPGNPVFLTRVCGHIALLNTKALNELGIDDEAADSEGRVFERDSQGRLTGIIKERAVEEAMQRIDPWSLDLIVGDILAGEYEAARNGLTTLHCILSPDYERELEGFSLLRKDGKLSLRYRIYLPVEALYRLEKGELKIPRDPMFKILGVKVYADGSLGARTAALNEPYEDARDSSGILRYRDEDLMQIVQRAERLDEQVLIHAIGDAAITQAIKAIEVAAGGRNIRRHRVEHCSLCTENMMVRLKKAGIGVTVQPHFIISDNWAEERLGEKRLRWLYPLKSLLRNGVKISGGSDAPVEPISPILGIWAAMVRANYSPEERLTLGEALQLYTKNASHAGFDEEMLGEVREGFLADLTILDSDIRDIHPAMLRKVGIAVTIVNGVKVYSYEGTA